MTIALVVGLLTLTALPAVADANPANHGHHYGQLKHPRPTAHPRSTPSPSPSPGTTPLPTPKPTRVASHPPVTGSHTSVSTLTHPAAGPAIGTLPARLPEAKDVHQQPASRAAAAPFPWVVEALLPALALIWLLLLVAAMRRLRSVQPEGLD